MIQSAAEWLFQGLTPEAMLIVVTTVVFAGFLRGFVGFGASLIIVMVLSIFVGPPAAVAAAALSGIPTTLQLLPSAIRQGQREFIVPFGLATFLIAPLGTLILVNIDAAIMRMIISLIVLTMAAMLFAEWQMRTGRNAGPLFAAGSFAGLIQGGGGIGGPMAVAVALSRPGSPEQQRANVIGAVTALSVCNFPPLWLSGLLTHEVIAISLIITPFYTLSTWFGARFFSRGGQSIFRRAALAALAGIGLVTLALAVNDYSAG